jgi:hypothetical protein
LGYLIATTRLDLGSIAEIFAMILNKLTSGEFLSKFIIHLRLAMLACNCSTGADLLTSTKTLQNDDPMKSSNNHYTRSDEAVYSKDIKITKTRTRVLLLRAVM